MTLPQLIQQITGRPTRGRPIAIRPVRTNDGEGLVTFLRGLSKDTIYLRYVSLKLFCSAEAMQQEAQRLANRGDGHLVLVAQSSGVGRQIIAVAELARDGKRPEVAELAIVVADEHQRTGIGHALTTALLAEGRQRGITTVYAAALAENSGLRRLIAGLGIPYTSQVHSGDVTFHIAWG